MAKRTQPERSNGHASPERVTDKRDAGAFVPAELDDYGLTVLEFRLYCHMARRAGKTGEAWPSHATLAWRFGMSVASIKRALTVLEAAGLVAREGGGRYEGVPVTWALTPSTEWAACSDLPAIRLRVARLATPVPCCVSPDNREFRRVGHHRPTLDGGVGHQEPTGSLTTDLPGRSPQTYEGTPLKVLPEGHSVGRDDDATPTVDVKQLLTDYVRLSRARGDEPTARIRGHLATQLSRLAEHEGATGRELTMVVSILADEGKPPGHADYVLGDVRRHLSNGGRT